MVAVALAATSLVAVLAPGHARSLVRVFDGAAWVMSRKKDGTHTAQHLNLASGTPDRSRAFAARPGRVGTFGNMGIGYDPATGKVELASVDDGHLLGTQATALDPSRVRAVEGDGIEWLVDSATGVAQALVADDALNVTFSAPVNILEPKAELAPNAAGVRAGVDERGRLWVGLSTGQLVSLEADEVVVAGERPAARRLDTVRVAPPGRQVGVSIIDGQAHGLADDDAGSPALHTVNPGAPPGRAIRLPKGARLAERTSTTRNPRGMADVNVVAPGPRGAQVVRVALDGGHQPQPLDLPDDLDAGRVDPPVSTRGATVVTAPYRGKAYVVGADGAIKVHDLDRSGLPVDVDVQLVHGNVVVNNPNTNLVLTVDDEGRAREDRKYPDDGEPIDDPEPVELDLPKTPLPSPAPAKPTGVGPVAVPAGPTPPTTAPPGPPGAPTSLRAVAGKASVQLLWAPPTSGSPVATYEITCAPGCPSSVAPISLGGGTTTTTVTGLLVDGPRYAFQIRALDAAKRPGPTAAFPPVQPVSQVPGPPVCTTLTDNNIGDGELTVRWVAGPANGSRVDGFTAQAVDPKGTERPVTVNVGGTATSAKLPGLVNGVAYAMTVSATTAGASGPACTPVSAKPYGKPGAATGLRVDPLDGGLRVTWKAPDDGGSPILDATVTAGSQTKTVGAGALETAVGGLKNGQSYTVSVTLRNKRGSSAPTSGTGVPAGAISVSTPQLSVGDRVIRSTFSVNWNGHGSGSCTMVVEGAGSAGGSCSDLQVGGLAYSTTYTVRIDVRAADGEAASSPSASVRTNNPLASIAISKGAKFGPNTLCSDPSCARVMVELRNFPANSAFTVDCDSTRGTFDYPEVIRTDGNGYGSRGDSWFYGYPGTEVWCFANGVTSNRLRW